MKSSEFAQPLVEIYAPGRSCFLSSWLRQCLSPSWEQMPQAPRGDWMSRILNLSELSSSVTVTVHRGVGVAPAALSIFQRLAQAGLAPVSDRSIPSSLERLPVSAKRAGMSAGQSGSGGARCTPRPMSPSSVLTALLTAGFWHTQSSPRAWAGLG